jgi:hypothetical protein
MSAWPKQILFINTINYPHKHVPCDNFRGNISNQPPPPPKSEHYGSNDISYPLVLLLLKWLQMTNYAPYISLVKLFFRVKSMHIMSNQFPNK